MSPLVLGPLVRCVEATSAAVWVETAAAARVEVRAGDATGEAATFAVHGHHYALVVVDGLPIGAATAYEVLVDGVPVWPEPGSPFPPPVLTTIDETEPLRLAFGSCRTSVPHDAAGNGSHGVDALRAYAMRMADLVPAEADPDGGAPRWPDLLLFLGDQVYADETTAEMRSFITARRDIDEPPWDELRDYEEYAELYRLAWSDPAIRWLLSTLPTAMIFDDHDIRDDWNTSLTWRRAMEATSWWHDRIVAGLASYWVHQHLGNLTATERALDPLWRRVLDHEGPEELDLSEAIDAFADRADQDPTSYRWSFVRDFGNQARLVVVDSRAARVLEPGRRSIIDDEEMAWLDEQVRGGFDHLLLGTSLPFLLASGLHHLEAFNEALAAGAWGDRAARFGERLRQGVDLEHWAAFQAGFAEVSRMVVETASGRRGPAPATVTFLSGDVHHSYVSEAQHSRARRRAGAPPLQSRIVQAVCSPIRNPLPRPVRFATAFLSYGVAGVLGRGVALLARAPRPILRWSYVRGPWYDNNLATLEVHDRDLRMWWARGVVDGDDHARPRLEQVADFSLDAPERSQRRRKRRAANRSGEAPSAFARRRSISST
ncbi:alkaline phosphatase family protein [Nocardioides panacisoli]|uniref:alkaline phosphatase D family protein n=1 Tax=Nocardioides panacisoli TaxID=627624 RepID=UPI001C630B60|nr:alkaline phosphatase D family protein [Nocardioides panacisoli]QYJ05062.1 alkaline phosphatase family protein [Nocardioides panacisoli]